MRRVLRVTAICAAMVVALSFGSSSAHVVQKHIYLGVFATVGPPASIVFYGQDVLAREGGQVRGLPSVVKLSCFARSQDFNQFGGHIFRAFGSTTDGAGFGFVVADGPTGLDGLAIFRGVFLTDAATCSFTFSENRTDVRGIGTSILSIPTGT